MKIIDLLNKIANGEEVPKEIFYKKQWWKYNPNNDYEGTDWGGCFLNNVLICDLNDEVEIIEEKEIEKLDITDRRKWEDCTPLTVEIMAKINELIDEIKKLKEGK